MKIVLPEAWERGPWANGGGTTATIASWHDGDALLARLSVATIDRAGPFSRFPGYRRRLVVLDDGGGLRLDLGGSPHELRTGESIGFDGDDAIDATPAGPALVFNLIGRRDVSWSIGLAITGERIPALTSTLVIFALADAAVGPVVLPRHAAAIGVTGEAEVGGPVIFLRLYLP